MLRSTRVEMQGRRGRALWVAVIILLIFMIPISQDIAQSYRRGLNMNTQVVHDTTSLVHDSTSLAHDSSQRTSFFDRAAAQAYELIALKQQRVQNQNQNQRKDLDLSNWKRGTGGLSDEDRVLLAAYYRNASSVFEYGLGESTLIANQVGVPRYAGIDSDVVWVDKTRRQVSSHYRFYYADIGDTGEWGYPTDPTLAKSVLDYQVAPLLSEPLPFDVYMVDGRWRLACLLLSFLHASSRGGINTTVLLHDCYQPGRSPTNAPGFIDRPGYRRADHLLDLVGHSGRFLCAYRRKRHVTDEQLFEVYQQFYQDNQ